tara:strand:- start:2461 stop:3369 length:909 start_codon:yes stop_codon:yes gene_type:complete
VKHFHQKKVKKTCIFKALKTSFNQITLLIFILFLSSSSISQNDSINKVDEQNQKQGYWIFTNQQKRLPGYKPNQKIEEGTFLNNKKEGKWIFYYRNGNPKHILYYENGVPDGQATFFYKNGKIRETGTWRNNRWVGEYKQYYENGNPKNHFNYDDRGVKNGKQIYFHKNGNPSLIGTWNNGNETDDLAEYKEDGTANTERYKAGPKLDIKNKVDSLQVDSLISEKDSLALKIRKFKKPSEPIAPFDGNGYHEFKDKNGNTTKVGEFEDGLLVNGKIFKYDEKGKLTLTKIIKDRDVVKIIRE